MSGKPVNAPGGGKCIDAGKAIAHRLDVRVVIVPTLASNDAPCSALSVLYTPAGAYETVEFYPLNPLCVIVDTEIVAAAPEHYLVSGRGDAMRPGTRRAPARATRRAWSAAVPARPSPRAPSARRTRCCFSADSADDPQPPCRRLYFVSTSRSRSCGNWIALWPAKPSVVRAATSALTIASSVA